MRRAAVPLLLAVIASACSGGADEDAARRLGGREVGERAEATPFDFERPLAALALHPDDVARRLGSFEWTAGVEWAFSRQGDDAERVRVVERHRVRQSATGDFDVAAEVDPGRGPGSATGKEVIRAAGMTYARARYAAWRERPTDRGRDARVFRDESFSVSAAVLRLCGDAVLAQPAGEATALGRTARRFKLSLARTGSAAAPASRPPGAPQPDGDTRERLRFLEGRIPTSLDGELLLDAATGVPLRVRLAAAFGVKDEPRVRATVELSAQVKGLGGEVPAILAPKVPLPDERKPAGVAGALDAAGLRKRGDEQPARAEPADEPGE